MAVTEEVQQLADRMRSAIGGSLTDLPVAQMRKLVEQNAAGERYPVHRVEDRQVQGPHGLIPIRVYRPSDAVGLPVVLWFHGGGFVVGSIESGDNIARRLCAQVGAVVVNVGYRLAPEHRFPAAFDDCAWVYQWLVDGGQQELGVDSSRIALAGDSAGGTLALATSLWCRDRKIQLPRCQVSVYGAGVKVVSNPEFADLPFLSLEDYDWYWRQYLPDPSLAEDLRVSPGRADDLSGLPPLLTITAEHDPIRDAVEDYAVAIREAGGTASARRYDGMYHGFFGRPEMFESAREAHAEVTSFLHEHLCNEPVTPSVQ